MRRRLIFAAVLASTLGARASRADWTFTALARDPDVLEDIVAARAVDHWKLLSLRFPLVPPFDRVWATRVADDGTLSPLDAVSVGTDAAAGARRAFVCGATTCLFALDGVRLMGLDGTPKKTIALGRTLDAVWTGTTYLVAYAAETAGLPVFLRTVHENGTLGVEQPLTFAPEQSKFKLGWNGSEAAAVYVTPSDGKPHARRFDAAGKALGTQVDLTFASPFFLSIAPRGTGWAIATRDSMSLEIALHDAALTKTKSFSFTAGGGIDLAAVGTQTWAIFGHPSLLGVRIDAAGTLLDPTPITLAPDGGFMLRLRAGGAGAIAVHGPRVTLLGSGMTSVKTQTLTVFPRQEPANVAASGATGIVVWSEGRARSTRAATLAATGASAPIELASTDQNGPIVPFGTGYLQVFRANDSKALLMARTISTTGVAGTPFKVQPDSVTTPDLTDAGPPTTRSSASPKVFSVANGPSGAWIVWTAADGPTVFGGRVTLDETRAVRVASDLSVGAARHIGELTMTSLACTDSMCWVGRFVSAGSSVVPFDAATVYAEIPIEAQPRLLAAVGTRFLAAWEGWDSATGAAVPVARLFDVAGRPLAPMWTMGAAGTPVAIAGGTGAVVAWIDRAGALRTQALTSSGPVGTPAVVAAKGVLSASMASSTTSFIAWSSFDEPPGAVRAHVASLAAPPAFGVLAEAPDGGVDAFVVAEDAAVEDTDSSTGDAVEPVDASSIDAAMTTDAVDLTDLGGGCAYQGRAGNGALVITASLALLLRRRRAASARGARRTRSARRAPRGS